MGFTIDIDTGGTFTDGFFTNGGQIETAKVDTTPHDLTVCLASCIEEGAKKFGISTFEMLRKTEVIRYATTFGINTLLTRTGPKIGVIVTKGFEDCLYAEKGVFNPLFEFVLSEAMVMGIEEKVDASGKSIRLPAEEEVRVAVKQLLERGARIIVVSLVRATLNDAHERAVKEMIAMDYPRHFLGSVPMLLSTEVSATCNDALRTNAAVINAYLHRDMARFLFKADEDLRKIGYRKPLLIAQSGGGVARVSKTVAMKTISSGPAGGLSGSAFVSRLYGFKRVVCLDVGGTSTDIGIVINGSCLFDCNPVLEGVRLHFPIVALHSVGGGGGTIAKTNPNSKALQMGPESAGALPGPACYDLGGTEPTATDACVVLGYVDPDYFLGGRRKLSGKKAKKVIEDKIAKPLGVGVIEAAFMMVKSVEKAGAEALKRHLFQQGYDGKDFVMFAYGGGGGIFSHGIAQEIGIQKVYTFPFSAVFSAYGTSTLDVLHSYESSKKIILRSGAAAYLSKLDEVNNVVKELQDSALRDYRGEGFEPNKVTFSLELEMMGPSGFLILQSQKILLETEDIKAICDLYFEKCETPPKEGEIVVELLRLRASAFIPHYQPVLHSTEGASPERAYKGRRKVYWGDDFQETNIYERKLLQCGNALIGPAVIESEDTTVLVPSGKKYTVDNFLHGLLELA